MNYVDFGPPIESEKEPFRERAQILLKQGTEIAPAARAALTALLETPEPPAPPAYDSPYDVWQEDWEDWNAGRYGIVARPEEDRWHSFLEGTRRSQYAACARLLLEAGAAPDMLDAQGVTPLMIAANNGGTEVVSVLLASGVNINAKDSGGETPLHHAAIWDDPETVRLLLEHGAEIEARDDRG